MRKGFTFLLLFASFALIGLEYSVLVIEQDRRASMNQAMTANDDHWMAACMVSRITDAQLATLAETVARPATPQVFEAVMSEALAGVSTPAKSAALRALHDRDQARSAATQTIAAIADQCGYWRGSRTIRPIQFLVSHLWATNERFRNHVAIIKHREPDAAEQLYRSRSL